MIPNDSPSLKVLLDAIRAGDSLLLEGLWDAPKSFLASLISQATGRSVLVVTGGTREDAIYDNLAYFAPGMAIEFPAWETLPGEEIAPSPDIIGKRMEALHALMSRKGASIVLCPLPSLLQKIPPPELLPMAVWKTGDEVPFETIADRLTRLGYRRAAVVADKGEFAVRGGILDLFPVASPDPYRVDFFGDTIDSIRTFDPVGQKSIQKVPSLFLSPANEMRLLSEATRLVSILDYLGADPLILWDDLVSIEDNHVALQQMPGARSLFFYKLDELWKRCEEAQHVYCTEQTLEEIAANPEVARQKTRFLQQVRFEALGKSLEARRFFHPFRKVADFFAPDEGGDWWETFQPEKNLTLVFLNANETEEDEMRARLAATALPPLVRFERGYLNTGLVVTDIPAAIIPNPEMTQRARVRRQKWRSTYHTPAAEFHQLSPGDLVVHFHSGIGRFLGVERQVNHQGQEVEFLAVEYAENSKLFVPLSQAHLVSRYIGTRDEPPSLSQLGSKRWQTARHHAQAQIVGYANDLLQLYAARVAHGGYRYPPDSPLMQQFEADFPYEETHDQLAAIEAVKNDMTSAKAMDRLVCGDVGYGKTEVAMRAAFKAAIDGNKQVAVLVPTTVLAMQHFENFCQRMRGFPLRIEVISRFRTPKQVRAAIQNIEKGTVDIAIGTHRLLSQDIRFKDLGLLIIDEEQRFGVRAKEHLKKFKAGIDCLTLSATPIPRTLYMSLVNARDMSVINTPPQDRLPIKTILAETDHELMANALLREFARGGQAYFIHNRVETIAERATTIQKLVPSARIGIVHGKMDPDEIDPVFHQFKQGAIDLLFATTIVENGIDIPNANTILIDRADTYGLADLYQLRGRVGRWNRAAYAYFLIPKHAKLPEATRKRLNALLEAGGYGGGMKIAMRDLEIRGAGDILGVQQSGQVSTIGFHLYCKLLKKAIDALKNRKAITFEETKLEFSFDARIPDRYVNEGSLRMELYYRFGDASSLMELEALLAELKDRFGMPPEPVLWLYHLSRIRVLASAHRYTLLKFQTLSLHAEWIEGKEVKTKTFLLPKHVQSPQKLEEAVVPLLPRHVSKTP